MVTKEAFLALAGLLEGNVRNPFARKKNPQAEAVREAGENYGRLDFVGAYKCFKPAHEKVVADMQRVLSRNVEFAANKLAIEQQKPLAVAKETVQKLRVHAQQVIDQFDSMLHDLESKRQVQAYIVKGESAIIDDAIPAEESPPTTLNSASETRVDAKQPLEELAIGGRRYRKAPYTSPTIGDLYTVRDKTKGERVIRIVETSSDGAHVQVEIVEEGKTSRQPIRVAVDSLVRQAEKGLCSFLIPVTEVEEASSTARQPLASNVTMRLDIQNFSRCCGDIARANIKFDTQLIKDVGDGPFRAGNYEQAFLLFEQCGMGFSSAVASSRRAIADGRRALAEQKSNLSGKEIQDRNAEFVRNEHLIHTAEREFSTILEGLRMFIRATQEIAKVEAREV